VAVLFRNMHPWFAAKMAVVSGEGGHMLPAPAVLVSLLCIEFLLLLIIGVIFCIAHSDAGMQIDVIELVTLVTPHSQR
jgi:hypothetical protein